MTRTLVISPQAGLGNRLRALAGAMVLARQTGRHVCHAWYPRTPNDPRRHVAPLQQAGFGEFFRLVDALPRVDRALAIDEVHSEHVHGDEWFACQGTAQQDFGVYARERELNPADSIARSDAPVILLETSHRVRLSPSLGGCASDADYIAATHAAYRQLPPRQSFLAQVLPVPPADIGIAIRRGDFLAWYGPANQPLDDIRDWARELARSGARIALFSDDPDARRHVAAAIPTLVTDPRFEHLLHTVPVHHSGFLQFLYLALRCTSIYGTPGSSFPKEAALYGGRAYREVPVAAAT